VAFNATCFQRNLVKVKKLKHTLSARLIFSYQEGESGAVEEPRTLTVANLFLQEGESGAVEEP